GDHLGEARPGLIAGMLAAELLFAVAPAARRDHRGNARVGAAAIDRDRRAEALAYQCDLGRFDFGACGEIAQRVAGVLDLFQADDAAALARTLPAAAEGEPQRHITEIAK